MMSFFKKKWFWFIVILGIGGYIWYSRQQASESPYVTTQVRRGDIAQTVSASSTLLADQEIDLNFEVAGRIKQINVAAGDKVGQGDVLALVESVDLEKEAAKALSSLNKARAEAGVSDDTTRETEESAKDAKHYLEAVQDAEDQKVSAADNAYENAVDYEAAAQSYYDQVVSDDGADSVTAKSAKLTLTAAVNARKAANEAKDTARRNRDSAVQLAENSYSQEKERLKTLEAKSQKIIENSAIAIAQANYDIALNNLNKAQLKAPANGTVTVLNYTKGEIIGSANVQPFGRLLSGDFILEAKVPESDIAHIGLNQKASVTFDAFGSDEDLEATVVEIDPESTVIQDVVYYKVKLRLNTMDARLKAGMSGDIDVHVSEKKNILLLSARAIKQDGSTRYVEVVGADGVTTERRNVQVGLEGDEGQVEIISGVSEGENIVLETKK